MTDLQLCGTASGNENVYVRGQAYLAAGQGSAAAAEFQKILDHSGIVWNCWTGALARLGVARANAPSGKNLAGRRCRCRPRSSARRLQRFSHVVERRRPRHPHPEAGESRVRQAAIICMFALDADYCGTVSVTGVCFNRSDFTNSSEFETQPKSICMVKSEASWLLLGRSLPIGSPIQSAKSTQE